MVVVVVDGDGHGLLVGYDVGADGGHSDAVLLGFHLVEVEDNDGVLVLGLDSCCGLVM